MGLNNTLAPYTPTADKPWDSRRVQHLYQRLAFGATYDQVQAGLADSPSALVNQIIDGILAQPNPTPTDWAYWTFDQYNDDFSLIFNHKRELITRWVKEMLNEGFRAKLAFFWSNHFVTEERVYFCPSFVWSYYNLLHVQALGNFRSFVQQMGRNPAMLVYLNGDSNIASEPNENYARELMELFTMGESNGYTQDDIVEVSRALTGWRVSDNCEYQAYFDPDLHDDGQKTIFGQTGNWNFSDVHQLIFTLRADQTAHFICEKIYRYFVYEKVDQDIVAQLAQTFKDNDWELAPVFRQLFQSEHFFEERFINARIKSPMEAMLTIIKTMDLRTDEDFEDFRLNNLAYTSAELGQAILNPVDVAGWPGYHSWLTENTLTSRWNVAGDIIYSFSNNDNARERLRQLAISLVGEQERDPQVVTDALALHFLKRRLDPDLLTIATQYFKGEIPDNYFDTQQWGLYYPEVPYQILNLLYFLTRLPEWQLA